MTTSNQPKPTCLNILCWLQPNSDHESFELDSTTLPSSDIDFHQLTKMTHGGLISSFTVVARDPRVITPENKLPLKAAGQGASYLDRLSHDEQAPGTAATDHNGSQNATRGSSPVSRKSYRRASRTQIRALPPGTPSISLRHNGVREYTTFA